LPLTHVTPENPGDDNTVVNPKHIVLTPDIVPPVSTTEIAFVLKQPSDIVYVTIGVPIAKPEMLPNTSSTNA
jgi:hypothetical protein